MYLFMYGINSNILEKYHKACKNLYLFTSS